MPSANLRLTTLARTAKYGWRKLGNVKNFHRGRDSAFGLGVPVSAAGDGVIVESKWVREYGNYVKIAHIDGRAGQIDTSYHSLNAIGSPVGRRVKLGETIGYAGKSALGSTGSHLHFGLWLGGVTVDPDKYLTPGQVRTVTHGGSSAQVGSSVVPVRALQIALAARGYTIVVDSKLGAQTTAVLKLAQKALGTVVDGINGWVTWGLLKIAEDGGFGKQTIRALQADLGVAITGNWNAVTKKALQRKLGTTPDGKFLTVSIKRLQTHLGVVADGRLGPVTIKALQKRLNAGGL